MLKRISAHKQLSANENGKVRQSQLAFRCECKVSDGEDNLSGPASMPQSTVLQCTLCDTIQHAQCYGYLYLPTSGEHVCYTCLLDAEQPLLRDMELLCTKRRVLHFLHKQGAFKAIKSLSGFLGRITIRVLVALKLTLWRTRRRCNTRDRRPAQT